MKRIPNNVKTLKKTDALLKNPYIGFTSFQHFRDEELFSDTGRTEGWKKEHYPVYQDVEQNGRSQGFYPDTEIAYIRLLWKDFEPREGKYDFALTDAIFRQAEEKKQTVMLRLMPHTTRPYEDVPDWLKAEIECPKRPADQRVKDSPKDPLFLKKFARVVRALGARYDGRPSFYAMDISLTGAWGEGHGFDTYPEQELKRLIDAYTESFTRTHLLGQICSPALVHYANRTRPVGFRADGLGNGDHMNIHFPKFIYEMKDIWKRAPISFESFWYLGQWKDEGWDIDEIIDQTLKWHISSLNAKSSSVPFEWRDKIDAWLKKMGYRFSVRLVEYPSVVSPNDTVLFTIWIENSGVAPIYTDVGFTLRLRGEEKTVELESGVDVRGWMPGDTVERIELSLPDGLPEGKYAIEFRIGGGEYPLIQPATDTERTDDGYYYIADMYVQ